MPDHVKIIPLKTLTRILIVKCYAKKQNMPFYSNHCTITNQNLKDTL